MPKNRIRFSDDFVLRNNLVGIGTSTPRAKLDLIGSALISGSLSVGQTITNPRFTGIMTFVGLTTQNSYAGTANTAAVEIKAYNRDNGTISFNGYGNQILTLNDNFDTDAFVVSNYIPKAYSFVSSGLFTPTDFIEQAFRIDRTGNTIVGIGTLIGAKLDVRGSVILGVAHTATTGGINTLTTPPHRINGDTTIFGQIRPRQPFSDLSTSTSSNYVAMSPSIGDTTAPGALNFYVGTAFTTQIPHQILSLTNNVSGSLFRVNNPNVGFASATNLSVGVAITAIFEVNSNGNVGIGTSIPTYLFTVNSSGASPTLGLSNVLGDFTANTNSFSQVNTRNSSNGTSASSDIIATADTGTDTSNFIDLGINNSGFSTSTWTINGALDGYLYTSDANISIGAASNKYVSIFTGGTLAANERLRVTGTGNIGIGTTIPASNFHVQGNTLITGITTIGLGAISSPTINSTMSFELTNNTTLTIRVKGTDGTTRTGTITLT
jgi:hypothetical protein